MNEQHRPTQPDDLQSASRAMAEEGGYDDYAKKGFSYTAPTHAFRKLLVIILVLLLVGGAGFAAYWFFVKKDDNKSAGTPTNTSSQRTDDDKNEAMLITGETEHYVSNGFMLEFDYPKDWKVDEPTGEGRLTATSPALQLKQVGGKTITGQVVLKVRNKQQALPEFDKGNAVAVLTSEKVNYAKPSSVQRGSTYLSFLAYAGTSQTDRLDGLYITGDVGYQKGQAIPKADFTPVDPVISVSFVKCADSNCTGEAATTGLDASMWGQAALSAPLKKMLQSLVIN
ncbi:MAG TPA: hypothetical protein VFT16_02160 [Candidatus Saccharimonadales bacterium]|nr:hypothetical protein [Candidatus Saccharimonadales bacterium]